MEVWEFERVDVWGFERKMWKDWMCLNWGMLEWIYEESLFKFVSNVIIIRKFWFFLNV